MRNEQPTSLCGPLHALVTGSDVRKAFVRCAILPQQRSPAKCEYIKDRPEFETIRHQMLAHRIRARDFTSDQLDRRPTQAWREAEIAVSRKSALHRVFMISRTCASPREEIGEAASAALLFQAQP